MLSRNELHAFTLLPSSITNLSKALGVSPAAASKAAGKLIANGLAIKERSGKNVIVTKANTTLASNLDDVIRLFPRLPVEEILAHSSLTLIASLNFPLTSEELSLTMGVTRQWTHKTLKHLSTYGLILKTKDGYQLNPLHRKIGEFATAYLDFHHRQHLSTLAEDALILWQHGDEVLFTTKNVLAAIQPTAITAFSNYSLPLITTQKYYYLTTRNLTTSDIILQTILIDPLNKTYNAYACMLYEKTRPPRIENQARLYNLTNQMHAIIQFVQTHTHQEPYLPAWKDYEALAEQYGVR